MNLKKCLGKLEKDYDPKICLLAQECHSPGYHTLIPDGETLHSTLSCLQYSLCRLSS